MCNINIFTEAHCSIEQTHSHPWVTGNTFSERINEMGVFLLRKKRKLEGKSSPTNIRFDFHPFWKCPRKRNIQNGKISFIASQACNPSAHKNSNSLHMLALHKNHPSITLGTGFHHRLSEGVHPNKILVFLKNSPPRFREKFITSPHIWHGLLPSHRP